MEMKIGKKRKRSQSISLSEDCYEELIKIRDREQDRQRKLNIANRKKIEFSHVVETACWKLIEEERSK